MSDLENRPTGQVFTFLGTHTVGVFMINCTFVHFLKQSSADKMLALRGRAPHMRLSVSPY